MRTILLLISFFILMPVDGQEHLSLDSCIAAVIDNSPRLRDKQLINDQGALAIDNLKAKWYPQLDLNGKVSYQSDVVSLIIDDPAFPFEFPKMSNEQFGLNLDIRQTLYDGGLSKQQRAYESSRTSADLMQLEVDLNALKSQVSDLFFKILLLQENRQNLMVVLDNLKAREKVLLSGQENGVALNSDISLIQVETLKILQTISELDAGKQGALRMLEVYMGSELAGDVALLLPFLEMEDNMNLQRPEYKLFESQVAIVEAGKALTSVKRLPQFFAYGQAGVGMPGYNMLSDQVDTYYLLGAGLHWNIWDWNSVSREKQILEKKKQQIMNSRETFTMNMEAGMSREVELMEHFQNALSLDEKMLKMRREITLNAASQLDEGVISATEYLLQLNEESMARIRQSTHRLQLIKAIANYKLLQGTL